MAEPRIEQFRKMTEADPTNEIGHFSLGRELLTAGDFDAAVRSLRRTVELNPNIAKAYQLIGSALLKQNKRDEAITALTDGIEVADSRGEMMPRDEMVAMLKEIAHPSPSFRPSRRQSRPAKEKSSASVAENSARSWPIRRFAIHLEWKFRKKSATHAGARRSAWGQK